MFCNNNNKKRIYKLLLLELSNCFKCNQEILKITIIIIIIIKFIIEVPVIDALHY